MTFNAASRLRSLEDRSAALGSSRCELPGMHSVPNSAVLPYASGVGGLSRRLLNNSCDSVSFNSIRSKNHQIYSINQVKQALSSLDNERYYLDNISSLPFGHYSIPRMP